MEITLAVRPSAAMSALHERQKAGVYVRGSDGHLRCDDQLAKLLDPLNHEQTVEVLLSVTGTQGNPYEHLNAGQQSMSLRNKARGMLRNGQITLTQVKQAVKRVRG